MPVRSDAELARDWQAGSHRAFAEVYEKYSSSLFGVAMGLVRDRSAASDIVHNTFLRATLRITGLREPDRLRAWLFAIVRNEATDWHRSCSRETATDTSAMSNQLAADLPEPHTELSRSELAEVVWTAAGALQQRDREVLELHLRAGLEAGDLANALGVTPGHAAVMLSRLRDRMEKAIGALLIARLGRRECSALDALLAHWNGRFTLDVRSRVTRHVESCPVCARGRMQAASYRRLAPAMLPVFPVPQLLREQVFTSYGLVSQQLTPAQHPVEAARRQTTAPGTIGDAPPDSWSWREDGFPEPQPTKPSGTVGDLGNGPGADATPLAVSFRGDQYQPAVEPPTDPTIRLGIGNSPEPAPRRPPMLVPLATGLVALLVIGGIGAWRILGDPSGPFAGGSPSTGASTPDVSSSALTVGAPTSTTNLTISGSTGTPSPSPTDDTAAATSTALATATGTGAPTSAAHLRVSARSISFGDGRTSSSTTRTVTLTDDGGQPANWTAAPTGTAFSVSPGSGTLAPGRTVRLTVVLNRSGLVEGAVRGTLEISAAPTGGSFRLPLSGSVNNPPRIELRSVSDTLAYSGAEANCLPQTGRVSALVTDDSGVASVVLRWSDGGNHSVTLSQDGMWYGSYGPFSAVRAYTLTVTATDVNRNAEALRFTVSVVSCT